MKIGAPTILLFLIALALAGVGVLAHLRPDLVDKQIAAYDFWLEVAAFVVLTIGALKRED